jgi:hypothetical protein
MCVSLTDYHMAYTSTEQVSEKYKIEHSVTIDKNRTNDIQRSQEEDKKQPPATANAVFWGSASIPSAFSLDPV